MSDTIQNTTDNKRIAKNTLFLYFRMFITTIVALYTSRIVLKELGVEDFGIYNVIGGFVVFFAVIKSSMVHSTQRFLNYELGLKDFEKARTYFSTSINIHAILSLSFILLAETVGLWFVNNYINIPDGKMVAANWVYQFSIIATAINIMSAPYNAAIIAYERMSVYAYISILEVVLKLVIVYLLVLSADKLVTYSFLVMVVGVIVMACYVTYCIRNFYVCKYRYSKDKADYRALLGFSWWSFFGSVANMGNNQGLAVILNMYFGVVVNAAMGIANQINAAIYHFVSNFQTAFNPQIIKSYAAGDMEYFKNLILNTSKYSYYLLFFMALPVVICAPEVISLWLGQIPEYSVNFFRLMMAFLLIDAIQGPLWVSAQATGKIRNYQLLMSALIISNVPLSIVTLYFVRVPEIALVIKVIVNGITATARVWYLHRLYSFPVMRYVKEVVALCLIISVISAIPPIAVSRIFDNGILKIAVTLAVSVLTTGTAVYFLGLKHQEKRYVKLALSKFKNKIKR